MKSHTKDLPDEISTELAGDLNSVASKFRALDEFPLDGNKKKFEKELPPLGRLKII
jgi:hypothetical protein